MLKAASRKPPEWPKLTRLACLLTARYCCVGCAMGRKWLTARWFRFIAVPVTAGLPAGFAAFWFAIHQGQNTPYLLREFQPWVFAATAAWAGGLTVIKSYLDDIAKDAIKTLELAQQDLAHLLQSVRIVVGAKSKRFFDSLRKLSDTPDPGKTFFEITRPDLQIKQLIGAVRDYFQIKVDPNSGQRVKLSLMKPDGIDLVIVDWAPEADTPSSPYERFDGATLAGKAFYSRQLVISEDVAQDDRYRHFRGKKDQGSMFAYPVMDNLMDKVIYVINVVTSREGQFKDTPTDREKIEKVMEIYAERIVLENRLAEIKGQIMSQRSGGAA